MPKSRPFATESPWAQQTAEAPQVVVYLATAAPIEHAEAELRLRLKKNPHPLPEPDPDYVEYLNTHRAENLVLAITYPTLAGLGDAVENKRMEDESVMRIGKKSYGIVGHFPPTPSDPVLRLIFPRAVQPTRQNRDSSASTSAASNSPNAKSNSASRTLPTRASSRCNQSQLRITLPEFPELIASKPFSNSV